MNENKENLVKFLESIDIPPPLKIKKGDTPCPNGDRLYPHWV